MPTFGSQPGSWTSYAFNGFNNNNQQAFLANVPAGTVVVSSLSCYFSGDTAPLGAQLCIWDSTGTLLASTPKFNAPTGTQTTGGQSWQTQSLSGTIDLTGRTQVYLGWWRDPASGNNCIFSYASGSSVYSTTANSTSAGNLGTTSAGPGAIGAYATYTTTTVPQNVYVRRSGAWTVATPGLRRSGAWTVPTTLQVYVRRSGAWTQIA